MNFLTNAVKYTRSGYIRMGYSIEKDGIRFYVEDTGTGIPKELQDRVFGRFQKLNGICSRYRTWIGNLPGNC